MSIVKNLLKKIIPTNVRLLIRRVQCQVFGFENDFKNMSNNQVFNKIYKEGIWGTNEDGESLSGRGSHTNEIIQPYISEVSKFLLDVKPQIVVDLGCGDFHIGKNFVNLCDKYIACDVSSEILNRDRDKFSLLKNVDFNLFDLTSNCLPKGNVCFVRQVLQHLSNTDIKNFVNNLNSQKPYKYLVITEHLPISDNFKANVDKGRGSDIRLKIGSGVVLHKDPFNLNALRNFDLLEVYVNGGRIKTTIYEF